MLPRLGADVDEVVRELDGLAEELAPAVPTNENPAKRLAIWLGDRVPVVWGAEGVPAVAAMRWKTQLNENGKVPAFASTMSELDHNEVVGWTAPYGERFAVIGLRDDGEPAGAAPRFPLSADIVAGGRRHLRRGARRRGRSPLARCCPSSSSATSRAATSGSAAGVDPTPVAAIDRLKAALAGRG